MTQSAYHQGEFPKKYVQLKEDHNISTPVQTYLINPEYSVFSNEHLEEVLLSFHPIQEEEMSMCSTTSCHKQKRWDATSYFYHHNNDEAKMMFSK